MEYKCPRCGTPGISALPGLGGPRVPRVPPGVEVVMNGYAIDNRSWWARLMARLFPSKPVHRPDPSPEWSPGYMLTEVGVHLDLIDRLRTLVSGNLMMVAVTQTNEAKERSLAVSTSWAAPPGDMRHD